MSYFKVPYLVIMTIFEQKNLNTRNTFRAIYFSFLLYFSPSQAVGKLFVKGDADDLSIDDLV